MPTATTGTLGCYCNYNVLHPYINYVEATDWAADTVVGGTCRIKLNDMWQAGVPLKPRYNYIHAIGTIASATNSTTFVGSSGFTATDDLYNGKLLEFTSGALIGQRQRVLDYTSGRSFTMESGFTGTPSVSDAVRAIEDTFVDGLFVGLEENTSYDIELTFTRHSRSGNLLESFTKTGTYTTKSSVVPAATGLSWYLDPTNGSDAYTGHAPAFVSGTTGPKKTMESVKTSGLAAGDTIYLVGVYNATTDKYHCTFDLATATNYRLQNTNGTADNWIHIRPYTANTIVCGWEYLNPTWAAGAANTYTATVTKNYGAIIDTEWNNQQLYPFLKQTGTSSAQSYNIYDYPTTPGWTMNTSTKALVLRPQDGTDPTGQTTRYKACYAIGISLTNCDYINVEDILFDGCIGSTASSADLSRNASLWPLTIAGRSGQNDGCHNVRVKNCQFHDCLLSIGTGLGTGYSTDVLIDECEFTRYGPWEQIFATDALLFSGNDPYDAELWHWTKNNTWDSAAIYTSGGDGLVIRNTTIEGFGCIQCDNVDSTMGKYLDVYNCTISKSVDDMFELDSRSAIAAAIFNNNISKTPAILSCSHYDIGPLFFFGNLCQEFLHTPLKVGNQAALSVGFNPTSCAYKWIVNNTFYSDRVTLGGSNGGILLNGVHGGDLVYNNIFMCNHNQIYGYGFGSTVGFQYPKNIWSNNVIYKKIDVSSPATVYASGTTTGSPTAANVATTGGGLSSVDSAYNSQFIFMPTSGDLNGVPRLISDYVGSTKTFTFTNPPGDWSASSLAAGVTFNVLLGDAIISSTAYETGTKTTVRGGNSLCAIDDAYNNFRIIFTSGPLNNQQTYRITDYVGLTREFTVDAMPKVPRIGDSFTIIPPQTFYFKATKYTTPEEVSAAGDNVALITGSINVGTSNSTFTANAGSLSGSDNTYNGMMIEFTSGALIGERTQINDYTGTSKTFVITPGLELSAAPANGDTFTIYEDYHAFDNLTQHINPFPYGVLSTDTIPGFERVDRNIKFSGTNIDGISNMTVPGVGGRSRRPALMGHFDESVATGAIARIDQAILNIEQGIATVFAQNNHTNNTLGGDDNNLSIEDINAKWTERLYGDI